MTHVDLPSVVNPGTKALRVSDLSDVPWNRDGEVSLIIHKDEHAEADIAVNAADLLHALRDVGALPGGFEALSKLTDVAALTRKFRKDGVVPVEDLNNIMYPFDFPTGLGAVIEAHRRGQAPERLLRLQGSATYWQAADGQVWTEADLRSDFTGFKVLSEGVPA